MPAKNVEGGRGFLRSGELREFQNLVWLDTLKLFYKMVFKHTPFCDQMGNSHTQSDYRRSGDRLQLPAAGLGSGEADASGVAV